MKIRTRDTHERFLLASKLSREGKRHQEIADAIGVSVARVRQIIRKMDHEWQPIETAPRDGRLVLIWVDDEINFGYTPTEDEEEWGRVGMFPCKPTHWMPLPAPPSEITIR